MKSRSPMVACLVLLQGLSGCIDYIQLEDASSLGMSFRFAPVINSKHISPHPSLLVETASVGKNCRGVTFRIPPVEDRNKNDRLYYLWFIDNKLAHDPATIEPEYRDSAVISLHIDQQFLLSHFEGKLPKDFFKRPHVIEFLISDMEYTIPESRYHDDAQKNEDYAYWIISFNNDPC